MREGWDPRDFEESFEARIKFVPQDMWVGVYWWKSPIGLSRQEQVGYQLDIYICVVPMLPIHFRWVRKT